MTLNGHPPAHEPLGDGTWRVEVAGGHWTLVDETDLPVALQCRWALINGYAKNSKRGHLHRLVQATDPGWQVDHINRDRLDNRRINLRAVTHQGNVDNTTRSESFGTERHGAGWRVVIKRAGIRYRVSGFATQEQAVVARDALLASL